MSFLVLDQWCCVRICSFLALSKSMFGTKSFKFLSKHHSQMQIGQFRSYILKHLVTALLSGHANAVPLLQFAWNFENNRIQMRQILLNSMGTYYAQNPEDQSRLTRILEVTFTFSNGKR